MENRSPDTAFNSIITVKSHVEGKLFSGTLLVLDYTDHLYLPGENTRHSGGLGLKAHTLKRDNYCIYVPQSLLSSVSFGYKF